MSSTCKVHKRYYCSESKCRRKREEAQSSSTSSTSSTYEPSVIVNSEGNLGVGIGGGMYVDTTDGSVSYGTCDTY